MKLSKAKLSAIGLTAALAAFQTTVHAADLFRVNAVTRDDMPQRDVTVGSSNFTDLVQNVIDAQGKFSVFENRNSQATLTYAGVKNAMTFEINQNETQAVLKIPITGFHKEFTGSDRDDLNRQIVDFLKKDGANEYAKFLAAINQRSPVAVSDGQPTSTTATIASTTFNDFGSAVGTAPGEVSPKSTAFGLVADVGTFKAGDFTGHTYTLPLSTQFRLSQRVDLRVDVPLQYIDVESAYIVQGAVMLHLPIKLIMPEPVTVGDDKGGGKETTTHFSPLLWMVTPTFGAAVSGSPDMASGGLILGEGLTNLLAYDFGKFTLSMGNHISFYQSVPVTINGYEIDPDVDQQILKNGLRLSVPLGPQWVVEIYGIHTKFLQSAAVDSYFTVGGDLGFRFMHNQNSSPITDGYLRLGFYSDLGSQYQSGHLQLGAGWKF